MGRDPKASRQDQRQTFRCVWVEHFLPAFQVTRTWEVKLEQRNKHPQEIPPGQHQEQRPYTRQHSSDWPLPLHVEHLDNNKVRQRHQPTSIKGPVVKHEVPIDKKTSPWNLQRWVQRLDVKKWAHIEPRLQEEHWWDHQQDPQWLQQINSGLHRRWSGENPGWTEQITLLKSRRIIPQAKQHDRRWLSPLVLWCNKQNLQ